MATINNLLSLSKKSYFENEQKAVEEKEKEINQKISLYILHKNFLSFKETSINL